MQHRYAVFLINLLQDVNIVRPLVFMASRDLGFRTQFLVTRKFLERDNTGTWQQELNEISRSTDTTVLNIEDEMDSLQLLENKTGVLVAASESNLSAHFPTHDIFRLAPASFLKITLQHGFECVGFLQSRDHNLAHGSEVTFAADLVCGWCEGSMLTSMTPSQRSKLYVTGPPAVLQMSRPEQEEEPGEKTGIVCENLHSVRLNISGDFKVDFIDIFSEFCQALEEEGREVTLRPHPGGQYVLKNNVALPSNVTLNNNPVYKVNLKNYAYGISAPSSVLIDMALAGIPVAVWRDGSKIMDVDNYSGLTEISTLREWLEFSREAVSSPEVFLDRQRKFLDKLKMPLDPADVYHRYAALFQSAKKMEVYPPPEQAVREHVMYVANGFIPTLQLSFIKPLSPLVETGEITFDLVTEKQMKNLFGIRIWEEVVHGWLDKRFDKFKPTMIVFCRYNGLHARYIVSWARREGIPIIYHIDDDLLNVPIDIGKEKHRAHSHPLRTGTVRFLIDNADLVYCSTARLKERFEEQGFISRIVAGRIYCSGNVLVPPSENPVAKVGYMGIGHEKDLEIVLPAIVEFMRRNDKAIFELFGSIPRSSALEEFGRRVKIVNKIEKYEDFLGELAKRRWAIGICPLQNTSFNLVKANTKWVEYTSAGIAVIASAGTVYDECCADGCGILAETQEQWLAALEKLYKNENERMAQVARAQARLENEYSTELLREQVMDIFKQAKSRAPKRDRILFIANGFVPTLQLSFIKPLAPLIESGTVSYELLTEKQMKERSIINPWRSSHREWIAERLNNFNPTMLVFCRYSGPHTDMLVEWAKQKEIPVIFHIDDDLLHIPMDLGWEKYDYHNNPRRLSAVRYLLNNSDIVYCSTEKIKKVYEEISLAPRVISGRIYCSGKVLVPAADKPVTRVGYMASSDHVHNFNLVLPAVVQFLRRNPEISFELFGSITKPAGLDEFGERVTIVPPIGNYEDFLTGFAAQGWDIGICPLNPIEFNLMKANTKWVEYTSVGAAVVASKGTVYDDCCAGGCGILAGTTDEWLAALEKLTHDPEERFAQVVRAQKKLGDEYSVDVLREQVLDVLEQSRAIPVKCCSVEV